MAEKVRDDIKRPPFETASLREGLAQFFRTPFIDPVSGVSTPIGRFKWGVYAFFDYDGEPIYVGQTKERVSSRISRHLTNQRSDAVAMSVLDPFEVLDIEVWPLPQYQSTPTRDKAAVDHLNALERKIYDKAIAESEFRIVLNEKNPPEAVVDVDAPPSLRGRIVSDEVLIQRSHPDIRIARRAQVISRLAQVIEERQVQGGLRRSMTAQARRLHSISERRYYALGGELLVEREDGDEEREDDGSEA